MPVYQKDVPCSHLQRIRLFDEHSIKGPNPSKRGPQNCPSFGRDPFGSGRTAATPIDFRKIGSLLDGCQMCHYPKLSFEMPMIVPRWICALHLLTYPVPSAFVRNPDLVCPLITNLTPGIRR